MDNFLVIANSSTLVQFDRLISWLRLLCDKLETKGADTHKHTFFFILFIPFLSLSSFYFLLKIPKFRGLICHHRNTGNMHAPNHLITHDLKHRLIKFNGIWSSELPAIAGQKFGSYYSLQFNIFKFSPKKFRILEN